MAETMRKRRNKWDVPSEPQNPIEHNDDPPIKSNNSADGDIFTSQMKSPDYFPTTVNGGSYGSDNDAAMMENKSTYSMPSKTETDPGVLSNTKVETDKFVEYSQMKDEDLDFTEGKSDNINLQREGSDISPKKPRNNRTLSPGHDPWMPKSPAKPSWGVSKRNRSRSRSRSRSRGRSRSRSPPNNHRWRSLRSRSRSRSPYHRSRREPDDSMDRGKRGLPCRDFAARRCRRGVDCRFVHDDTARRAYNPHHDVGDRKFERENAGTTREPLENTRKDERGYPQYSREPVENTRRNERGSLQNSREPTEIAHRNERENFREPIDNTRRNERENFRDSGEPIDNSWRKDRENHGDSREPMENTRRNERGSLQNSREPTENSREHLRENFRDSREPQRSERENLPDSREPNDSAWRSERENLGDSKEPTENARRNEREDLRDSRDRFSRNDSRPAAICYDFLKGLCQRGSECRFAHQDSSFDNGFGSSRDEYRTRTQRVIRDTVCKFFADGCCRRGQSCNFSHVILGPSDGNNDPHSRVNEDNMYQNQEHNQNHIQSQHQHQTQNQAQSQHQNIINPLPFPLPPPNIQIPLQPPNIQIPQLVPTMPVDDQMQAMLSIIQNGPNQFVPQPNSNFNMPIQNLPVVPPQNFNLLPSNTAVQQIQPTLPFTAPNFVGPLIPAQPSNPENQAINSEVQPSLISNDITQKVVTSEQAAQITNISASLARFFGNGGALNPQIATGSGLVVPPIQDPVAETETNKIAEVEVKEGAKETGAVSEKKEGEDVESKQTKDGKGMKMFKCAIVDFVKDALKPNWKEGQLSREAHKTIVKKVVEKVTGAMQSHTIPQTQEKIDSYMTHSKAKLSRLVQAYVEKYVKG